MTAILPNPDARPINRLVEALLFTNCEPKLQPGGTWTAKCPAHEDGHPSLSVREGDDGRVLVKCHAGCAMDEIVCACGLEPRDLFATPEPAPSLAPAARAKSEVGVTRFEVRDTEGELRAIHVREDKPDGTKSVRWERPDGKRGLGGCKVVTLPLFGVERLRSTAPGARVLVVEGEKAAAALHERGVLAVGTVTGASATPEDAVLADLARFEVVLWPDRDAQGMKHMARVAGRLAGMGSPARGWVSWAGAPDKGDAADYLAAGGTPDAIDAMVDPALDRLAGAPTGGPVMRRMSEVECEDVEFLWHPYIPRGKLTLLEGDPGVGKSHLALRLAADLSCGVALPGDGASGGVPCASIYVTCEDGLGDTVCPRLKAMGADLAHVHALEGKRAGPGAGEVVPITLLDLGELEQAIRAADAALVVVDPVQAHLGSGVDMNSMTDVRRVLAPLALLAERTKCAMLLVRHFRKSEAAAATHAGSGSIDFSAAARAVLQVRPDDTDPDAALMLHAKASLAQAGETLRFRISDRGLEWDGTSPVRANDYCGDTEARAALAEAMEFLRDALGDGSYRATTEVEAEADAAGIKKRTLRRARKHLGVIRQRRSLDGAVRWEMSLPPAPDAKAAKPAPGAGPLAAKQAPESGSGPTLWPELPDHDGDDADGEAA